MGMNWLYGPKEREDTALSGSYLRSMLLDVEVFRDIARETIDAATETWRRLYGEVPSVVVTYQVDDRTFRESEISDLSVWDKDRLRFSIQVYGPAPSPRCLDVHVDAQQAFVAVAGSYDEDLAPLARSVRTAMIKRLQAEGKVFVRWPLVRARLPWLLPIVALVFWAWFWLTEDVPLPGILLFGVAWVALAGWAWAASAKGYLQGSSAPKGFRFRAVAKAETDRARANTAANVRVAFITAPIAVVVTLVGAIATGYLSGNLRGEADADCRSVATAVAEDDAVSPTQLRSCLSSR